MQRFRQRGLTYVEVLVATLLIALTLVPALDALTPGIQGSALHKQRAELHYFLQGKMEEMLAEDFDALDAAATAAGDHTTKTSYSDTAGPIPFKVFIGHYDADNADLDDDVFTGGEADLLWIKVRLTKANKKISLQTLVSRY